MFFDAFFQLPLHCRRRRHTLTRLHVVAITPLRRHVVYAAADFDIFVMLLPRYAAA